MAARVRFAPSPTGFLHIGSVHTALFNWLFARHEGGEFLLRIENTDTSREVAQATDQIQESLRWLGLDWDGQVTFQLERMVRAQEVAKQLVAEEKAYEDEGAARFRMPDEGVTAWDDLILGNRLYRNESDGKGGRHFVDVTHLTNLSFLPFTTEVVVCLPSDSALPFTRRPSLQATMPITSAMNGALIMPTSKWVTETASCSRAMKMAGPMPP